MKWLNIRSYFIFNVISVFSFASLACGQGAQVKGSDEGSGSEQSSDTQATSSASSTQDQSSPSPSEDDGDDLSMSDESTEGSSSGGESSGEGEGSDGEESPTVEESDSNTVLEPDDVFADIQLSEHPKVKTIVVIDWSQLLEADAVWAKFSFDEDVWLESPKIERKKGMHSEVLLGIPEGLTVDVQLMAEVEGQTISSGALETTNGMAPDRLPRPKVINYDSDLASAHPWLLGNTVESRNNNNDYGGPNWNYIIDRKGRVVWYYRVRGGENGNRVAGFWPRISRDGTHITMDEQRRHRSANIRLATLDFAFDDNIEIPGSLGDCYDITTDGSVLYENRKDTFELLPSGEKRTLWKCDLGSGKWDCYSNTVNWDEQSDSLLLSFPYKNTVVRLDRETGEVLGRWGEHGDWKFDPPSLGLGFNHWPSITPEGTFMVSSHSPGGSKGVMPHLFMEYTIDDENKTLVAKWIFGEGTEDWAEERGVVNRVQGGNVIANYGWGGVILEITPEKQVAWRIEHDVKGTGKRQRGKLLGNVLLLNDLYKINRGPQRSVI